MAYPDTIDEFPTRSTDDIIPASDYNGQNDSILSIENTLGTNPEGGETTVKDRLNTIEGTISGKVNKTGDTLTGDIIIDNGSSTSPKLKTNNSVGSKYLQIYTDGILNRIDVNTDFQFQWGDSYIIFKTASGGNRIEFHREVRALAVLKAQNNIEITGTISVNGSAGASGSFTTVDGKTVTVINGIITSIV